MALTASSPREHIDRRNEAAAVIRKDLSSSDDVVEDVRVQNLAGVEAVKYLCRLIDRTLAILDFGGLFHTLYSPGLVTVG